MLLENLTTNQNYIEYFDPYYILTFVTVEPMIKNNGYNEFYKNAVFSVKTNTGRSLENLTLPFYETYLGSNVFRNNNLKIK
ncbi:hypothetical protein J2810_004574 [Chryseobacterium rhizosphaerae]|uniref:hypothetical protein n=1 Tax=Chryseobacterium rhizosphaerae TaxID=395937 RepID=UPI002861E469|nr:hypothetical protein [Chryseobacterium rhizosphaerae]MDR6548484.1 hypothetical protein [Chryseobacterium rhizosphaerae]